MKPSDRDLEEFGFGRQTPPPGFDRESDSDEPPRLRPATADIPRHLRYTIMRQTQDSIHESTMSRQKEGPGSRNLSRDQASQLMLEDLQRTRAQMHEQMEMMQRILQASEKRQSPDSLVNVEPRSNADHRGLTDGSLEAGGRDPRPKHQKSFGDLCPSEETMASENRGATRCVSAGERV